MTVQGWTLILVFTALTAGKGYDASASSGSNLGPTKCWSIASRPISARFRRHRANRPA